MEGSTKRKIKIKINKPFLIGLLVAILVTGVGLTYLFVPKFQFNSKKIKEIHLAVAGPMDAAGQTFLQAAQIYADHFNQESHETGLSLVLHPFDDANDKAKAPEVAQKIASDPQILGVIGHNFSSVSIAAGQVYKEKQLVAISPTATNILVTQDNDWVFRNIFNDHFQGQFLAQYSRSILGLENIGILYEDQEYGTFLAEEFTKEATGLGLKPALSQQYLSAQIQDQLEALATAVAEKEISFLFIAGHAPEVVKIIEYLREHDYNGGFLLPDALANQKFTQAFANNPKEIQHPGYFTDGIYVASPLLYESASAIAQEFKQEYKRRTNTDADWRAAYAYDAAMMLAKAAQLAGLETDQSPLAEQRKKLRDQLAQFNQLNRSFAGVTGINFFNAQGDMEKPLTIGQFRQNKLIPAPMQMKSAGDPKRISGLDEQVKAGLLTRVDNDYFYRTYIVYTGVEINQISELNKEEETYKLDFDLWFRYRRGIDVRNIEFCNGAEPIKLRLPIEEIAYGNQIYRRYQVTGKFKLDYVEPRSPEHHNLGVCFVHKELSRHNLIFVPDTIGGDMVNHEPSRQQKLDFKRPTGWMAEEFWHLQSIFERPILGNIKYIHEASKKVDFSSFYSALTFRNEAFLIRYGLSPHRAVLVLPLCILLLVAFEQRLALRFWLNPIWRRFSGGTKKFKVIRPKPKPSGFSYFHQYEPEEVEIEAPLHFEPGFKTWCIKLMVFLFFLYNLEIVAVDFFFQNADMERLGMVRDAFDILWWIVPSVIFIKGMGYFGWAKLEERLGHVVPFFARAFLYTVVAFLSFFGILAFVYGETATSILGTSGIFVMIIGMAIQMNISNIFAGLVLSVEKAIKLGDWVQIGEIEEGRVVAINWRTIQIQTREGALISIPNNTISDSNFQNFTSPNNIIEEIFPINLEKHQEYPKVCKVFTDAMKKVPEVLDSPPPEVRFDDFTHWSARYKFVYYIDNYGRKREIAARVWEQVIIALKEHDIETANFREEPEMDGP